MQAWRPQEAEPFHKLNSPIKRTNTLASARVFSQSVKEAAKASRLCKGRWQKSAIFAGGVVNEKFNICKMQLRIRNIS